MSRASDIAAALAGRLGDVTLVNGYLTDAGLRVYRGKRKLTEEDLPCAVLVEDEDKPKEQDDTDVSLSQGYIIEGHAKCDPDNPNDTAHDIIADIKRAIFSGDPRLGGLVSKIRYTGRMIQPREDGLSIVAAAINIEVDYAEDLASP